MKTKKLVLTGTTDKRLLMVKVGDTVLCRMPFPRTTTMLVGRVEKLKDDKNGVGYIKIKGCKEWFSNKNFYKLADK